MARFDLNLLNALDALLREKSVTAAADRIGVSQPTMSGMLQRLREQLEDPLLVRVGRSFELTKRATQLTEQVRQLLLSVACLVEPGASLELDKSVRHVRIMASEFSNLLILPNVFQLAAEQAPSITFEVLPIEDPAESVHTGATDFCITGNTIAEIEGGAAIALRTQTLLIDRFVGLVSEDHPLKGEVTVEEFMAFPHAATQFPGISRTVEDTISEDLTREFRPRIGVPSFMAIGAVVANSNMIGTMPSRLVPLIPKSWAVRVVKLPDEFHPITLRLLWHSRHDHDPIHQWLRGTLLHVCGKVVRSSPTQIFGRNV